jgi:HEAT repeat protein
MGWITDWIERRKAPDPTTAPPPSESPAELSDIERLLWRAVSASCCTWPVRDGKQVPVHAYLLSLDSRSLVAFEQRMRSIYFPHDRVLPDDILDQLASVPVDASTAEAVRFVASLHRSGYVRERAVREMSEHPSRLALTATLLRTTDWVEAVRTVAAAGVTSLLAGTSEDDVFACLPLVLRMYAQSRADDAWLDDVFGSWLLRDPSRQWRALESADARVRRWAYRLALAAGNESTDAILEKAMHDADPVIVTWALGSLHAATDAHRARLIDIGLRTKHPMARQMAVRLFVEQVDPLPPGFLHTALLDSSIGIRSFAAYVMRTRGLGDPADTWRAEADAGTMPIGAVISLAELSGPPDEPRLRRALNHPNSRARVAAVRALRRMHATLSDDDFLSLLTDDSPRVRNVLGIMCRTGDVTLDQALLRRVWLTVPDQAASALTGLLNALAANDSLAMLVAFEPLTPAEATWWNGLLAQWADTSLGWWPPQPNEKRLLADLLASQRPALDDTLRTRFRTSSLQ